MIYVIGFLAQVFFSARILLQWILSERAKKVISPAIFWQLSIVGSYLLFVYGWLRDDFAIILGQIISYYIYIWNLDKKHQWKKLPFIIRTLLLLTPVAAILYMLKDASALSISSFGTKRYLCGSWFMGPWDRLFLHCVSFTSGFIPSEKMNRSCR